MFAVYAKEANYNDPLASVIVGERPEPIMPEGWVRVRVTHASLNRHDIFTLLGVTAQKEPIPFPMILGNDGAGLLDDGTPVVIYPLIGSDSWRGDETLDPAWHVFSELVPGTMADYVAVPRRNAIPMPEGLSPVNAALLGTAWLTAYRTLFTKSGLRPGENATRSRREWRHGDGAHPNGTRGRIQGVGDDAERRGPRDRITARR